MGTRAHHAPAYRKLCRLLRDLREESGLTIRALGLRLRKPYSFVSKVERGERRIDPVEFVAWCRACDANPSQVIQHVGD
jgi:transcriptional regulator with XRE-family HTH domain